MNFSLKQIIKNNFEMYKICMLLIEKYNKIRWEMAMKNGGEQAFSLISREYKKHTGKILNNPPISYTEKIQFAKIYDSTEFKAMLTDKFEVRKWIKDKIGEQYLIPLLGVWDKFDDIEFQALPKSFVLKTNNASGTNLVVKDKQLMKLHEARKFFDLWMKQDFAFSGRGFEMHYSHITPKIIAEKYIVDSNGELNDYKFLCFNGVPHYCWVDVGRFTDHRRNVYDMNWILQPWNQYSYRNTEQILDKPDNFDDMIRIVKTLCKGIPQVRVDLYSVKGKIYFGEMTFTNGKGYELIYPEKYNVMLGSLWKQKFYYCVYYGRVDKVIR